MVIKIIIIIITALFIAWGLCRGKRTDEIKIRKTDSLFTIISLMICIALTILGTSIHLTKYLWFLLLPAITISLMCVYAGRQRKQEPDQVVFSITEKFLIILIVVFLCSGAVDCSYRFPLVRFTSFYMSSMFYKMLGGWILADLVFCRRFPLALVKAFFLIVFTVNVVRFIDVLWFYSIYRDGTYPLIQIVISFAILVYMYCRHPNDKKLRIKIEKS